VDVPYAKQPSTRSRAVVTASSAEPWRPRSAGQARAECRPSFVQIDVCGVVGVARRTRRRPSRPRRLPRRRWGSTSAPRAESRRRRGSGASRAAPVRASHGISDPFPSLRLVGGNLERPDGHDQVEDVAVARSDRRAQAHGTLGRAGCSRPAAGRSRAGRSPTPRRCPWGGRCRASLRLPGLRARARRPRPRAQAGCPSLRHTVFASWRERAGHARPERDAGGRGASQPGRPLTDGSSHV
jgi:hypothetical protein